jgi:hypothetical protein
MNKAIPVIMIVLLLLVIIAPAVRAEGLLSDIFDSIKKWFESSPLGNIFTAPVSRAEVVKLGFYPETFELNPADFVNITTAAGEISNFRGSIAVDMKNKVSTLREAGSTLLIKETIGSINIDGLKMSSLELRGMKLVLASGNWNETTENGSISMKDFLGRGTIKEGFIELEGNVSRISKG